jgi:phenylpropionate dioxygenase-like ring-hydroxylating dioxygenase large terminal subunit
MTNDTTTKSNGSRWHHKYPHLGTGPLPAEVFTSADRFARERERIFKKVWLHVGRVEQLPHPGSYFTKDLAICNTSVIVVRGKDGAVRAFHNICSHRGNKIVWDNGGTCRMFTCKFHGWSYGLDGRLTFVPDEERFFGLQKETLGLTPVAVDVWEGFIFINVDPHPQETLQEYLGELGTELAGYPFGEFSATWRSWTTEVKSNWKVLKNAFQEAYHAPFLHHRSLPDVASKTNPYLRALEMRLYPRHGCMSVEGNPVVVRKALRGSDRTSFPRSLSPVMRGAGIQEYTARTARDAFWIRVSRCSPGMTERRTRSICRALPTKL